MEKTQHFIPLALSLNVLKYYPVSGGCGQNGSVRSICALKPDFCSLRWKDPVHALKAESLCVASSRAYGPDKDRKPCPESCPANLKVIVGIQESIYISIDTIS